MKRDRKFSTFVDFYFISNSILDFFFVSDFWPRLKETGFSQVQTLEPSNL